MKLFKKPEKTFVAETLYEKRQRDRKAHQKKLVIVGLLALTLSGIVFTVANMLTKSVKDASSEVNVPSRTLSENEAAALAEKINASNQSEASKTSREKKAVESSASEEPESIEEEVSSFEAQKAELEKQYQEALKKLEDESKAARDKAVEEAAASLKNEYEARLKTAIEDTRKANDQLSEIVTANKELVSENERLKQELEAFQDEAIRKVANQE